ncbi:MAG: DUF5686 family protein [Bacteroidota bacterium]|nr:DUF5686 family protein [Bacteroidota bacterium]
MISVLPAFAGMTENAQEFQFNNPQWANDIVKKTILHKEGNRLTNRDYYKCERYEKLNMGWINLTKEEKQSLILRYFKFLFENTDSTDVSGKPVDFILSKETLEDDYYRKSTNTKRSVVKGVNREWVYSLLHEQGLRTVITEFFNDYCIYDNEMTFLTQHFVSPLSSSLSQVMYNYNCSDTLRIDGVLCYKIDFIPKNDRFLAFRGSMYIAGDSTYAVARSRYFISNNTNINYIDTVGFKEDFHRLEDGLWVPVRSDVSLEMSLFKIFTRRINSYRYYQFKPVAPAIFDNTDPVTYKQDAWNKPEDYWTAHRHFPVTNKEEKARAVLTSYVGGNGSGSLTGFLLSGLFKNYFPFKKFALGPVFSFVSSNDIEGLRLRFGGTTTAKFNPHLFFEGYGAYGMKDERWKYSIKAIYSFPKRADHPYEYPVNSISLSRREDLRFPGQELVNIDKDNVFLSWRRSPLARMIFEKKTELQYKREYLNGISYNIWVNNRSWQPVGEIDFVRRNSDKSTTPVSSLNTAELGGRFRLAVGERFYQNRGSRIPLSRYFSVFTFSHSFGIKGFLGGQYVSNLTEMSMQHAQSFAAFGYVDMMFKAGKQWAQVPYPLLIIPQANQSYLDVPETYNLMNEFEFVCDKYASLSLDYHMNGLLFNWMPVNRVLKLREVFSFKSLLGSLSSYNNPTESSTAPWLFPTKTTTYALSESPYTEGGVGIENIFSLLRIDYVWRLSHRDHLNIDRSGIRVGLKVQF